MHGRLIGSVASSTMNIALLIPMRRSADPADITIPRSGRLSKTNRRPSMTSRPTRASGLRSDTFSRLRIRPTNTSKTPAPRSPTPPGTRVNSSYLREDPV
jgi:hypothetical protein